MRMIIYEDLAYHLRGTHHSQHNLCLHHCTDDTPPTEFRIHFLAMLGINLGCNIPECGKFPAQSTAESNLSHHLLLLWKLYNILPSTYISMYTLSLKHSKFWKRRMPNYISCIVNDHKYNRKLIWRVTLSQDEKTWKRAFVSWGLAMRTWRACCWFCCTKVCTTNLRIKLAMIQTVSLVRKSKFKAL
jgi:hypothetical protein